MRAGPRGGGSTQQALPNWALNGKGGCYKVWYHLCLRITAKGQVTIPQEIREELGLLPNTEVTFDVVDGEARLRQTRRSSGQLSRGDGVIKHLRSARPSNKLTTDEIMALMRGKP